MNIGRDGKPFRAYIAQDQRKPVEMAVDRARRQADLFRRKLRRACMRSTPGLGMS